MKLSQAKEYLSFIQAAAEGKAIQYAFPDTPDEWFDCDRNVTFAPDKSDCLLRIKPEPKLRPWEPEEVPVGAIIRRKPNHRDILMILGKDSKSVYLSVLAHGNNGWGFDLLDQFDFSIDGGKTWKPCGVYE